MKATGQLFDALPDLTDNQMDAATLVRAIEVLDRLDAGALVRWYLKRVALRLARWS
jgi:hypothetical protein